MKHTSEIMICLVFSSFGCVNQIYLNIGLDHVRMYIDWPIVAPSPLILHPIPFRAYFERLVDLELDH